MNTVAHILETVIILVAVALIVWMFTVAAKQAIQQAHEQEIKSLKSNHSFETFMLRNIISEREYEIKVLIDNDARNAPETIAMQIKCINRQKEKDDRTAAFLESLTKQ